MSLLYLIVAKKKMFFIKKMKQIFTELGIQQFD